MSGLSKPPNVVVDKSYRFALNLISFLRRLPRNVVTFRLGDQVLRSGTSIGANVEEAIGAYSRDDFVYKMNTALKEARETNFWLRLMRDSQVSKREELAELVDQSEELRKILSSIVKSGAARAAILNSSLLTLN